MTTDAGTSLSAAVQQGSGDGAGRSLSSAVYPRSPSSRSCRWPSCCRAVSTWRPTFPATPR